MSAPPDNSDQGGGDPGASRGQRFEPPGPDPSRPDSPRLRRGLLGVRAGDVSAEIGLRDAEIAELRRDIAALWLAFGQHERTIQELVSTIEDGGGGALVPPGGRPTGAEQQSRAGREPGEAPRGASIAKQLSSLDEVLGAIEEATRTLERSYAEEIEEGGTESPAEAESRRSQDEGGEPAPGR